jgi:DNA-binding response OmpR family regulator
MKLLIIEDDPVISETVTICFNLRWPEAEVVVTDSGETGLKLATAEAPDVIILDVGLPEMDGYEPCVSFGKSLKPRLYVNCQGHRSGKSQGPGVGR